MISLSEEAVRHLAELRAANAVPAELCLRIKRAWQMQAPKSLQKARERQ